MSPGTSAHASIDAAADDDAAADASTDLDEQEVVDLAAQPGVPLAERHDVHVVVHEDRRAEVLRQHRPDRELVPARHDRRRDRYAVPEAHRSWHPDAGPVDLGGDPFRPELVDQLEGDRQDDVRALPDVRRLARVSDDLQLGVGDGDVDRGGADVDADEPQLAAQPDDRRAPAAAGGRQPAVLDQPEVREPVQLDGELGPAELHGVPELGPGDAPMSRSRARRSA